MADWWVFPHEAQAHTHPIKLARIWVGSGGTEGRVSIMGDYIGYSNGGPHDPQHLYSDMDWFVDDEWQHYRVTIDSSGGLVPGAGHGKFRFYRNNVLIASADDLARDEDSTSSKNYTFWRQAGIVDYSTAVTPHVGESYMSDIYMDNSQARIVLGDSPLWNNVRHYEMQIPQTWGPSSISFKANKGSFPNGTAYLFVINKHGVASVGEPIH